ncbi:MAG: hypothetical protein GWM90_30015 [Gemmatimonadetes bacterium]|nr:hypothetical protein [Gemmatimonadota bacterium]NIQ59325.1 hypothetical protein [Gemmatimonadota bacterium]NIU79513.1 hypothetical protein [Gammaproteobacteria bacterium]NIX48147.1 hypothetical protein [Gemmatimonadota bacterium]NIY12539.1 hypothetical protein [Gemmatimonadota bacterium]
MRELASRLLDESAARHADAGSDPPPEAAVLLLYERLRPVIGPGGFAALVRRAAGSLSGRHAALAGMADTESFELAVEKLHAVLGNGADEPAVVVAALVDELVGTLERMIGQELTARLIADTAMEGAGRDG